MKFSLWPWRYITGMAGAAVGLLAWNGEYPHANDWQLALAAMVGSFCFTVAYNQMAREVAVRRHQQRVERRAEQLRKERERML